MLLLHIGAFNLDVDSQRSSAWHRLMPHTRVLCALLFVFATALTPNGHWWTWAIYGAGLLGLITISQITLPVLGRRVAIELVFISTVLLGTLFRPGGTVVWQWGWLRITTEGLVVLGSVLLKALLSLLMMNLLVLTTSIASLLQALAVLRLPPLLIAILASMYRYLDVLIAEFDTMRRAAASRNLWHHPKRQRQVLGNMIGSLFIRTYDRGNRIHQAMLSRGYRGQPPAPTSMPLFRRDLWALTLTVLLLLLGQAVELQRSL